jgi:arylsulfatase A-like enzyme
MNTLPPDGIRVVKYCAVLLTQAALLIAASAVANTTRASLTPAPDSRPNILVIMTDDQGHDTLTSQFMPFTKSMIADQGVTFTRGYVSTAICGPSRASLLTGKYARNHGVRNNPDPLLEESFAESLHRAGYFTGMIGKYLNSWPGGARPEYDFWTCWLHGYTNPIMNVLGAERPVPGYLSYVLRDYAVEFLEKAPTEKPFFLLLAPRSPHRPATPAA